LRKIVSRLGFIGAGKVGTALAVTLSARGYPVAAVASRTMLSAERLASAVLGCQVYDAKQAVADAAELVFVTTPDDVIASAVAEVRWHAGQAVIHCSGADSLDILEPAKNAGAMVGSFHPLQTFADTEQAIRNLPGSTFALEGEGQLIPTLKEMVSALGGSWVELKAGDKVLYHAAAVFACNYTVTLLKLATDLWRAFGVSPKQATKALMPLLRGTVNNIESLGLPQCLTGPIARGDVGTITKHLEALESSTPVLLPAYRELGLRTIPIALSKGGIDEGKAKELWELLSQPIGRQSFEKG
jgi:predicted short-subunit dehydrogenase-like oxidoreductase (DUF2520 family)